MPNAIFPKVPVTATRQAMHFDFGVTLSEVQFVYGVSRSAIRNSIYCVGDCTASIKWESREDKQRENAKIQAWFDLMNTGDPILSRKAFIFTGPLRAHFQCRQTELFDELSARGWTAHEISERLSLRSKVVSTPQFELFKEFQS